MTRIGEFVNLEAADGKQKAIGALRFSIAMIGKIRQGEQIDQEDQDAIIARCDELRAAIRALGGIP